MMQRRRRVILLLRSLAFLSSFFERVLSHIHHHIHTRAQHPTMLARAAAALLRSDRGHQAGQGAAAATRAASTSAPGGAGIASGVPADLLKREVRRGERVVLAGV